MDYKKIKILFFGTPKFAVPCLDKLIEKKYNIIGVITQLDKPVGRRQTLAPPPIKTAAEEKKIPVFQFDKIDDRAIKKIRELKPDLIIVVAYGKFLPTKILNLPRYGCLNVHPSLLPKYRGPAPIQYAILNGEDITGVSIIKLDEKMDHGPIVAQKKITILQDDNAENLTNLLSYEGAELLINTISDYLAGKIKPREQNDDQATYSKILTKASGKIDWKKSPIEIYLQIRALYPWPGAWTDITGQKIKILAAHIENHQLIIDKIQPAGKQPMNYQDYLNGNEPLF